MAKNLKLTIKNTQIAEAINLGSLKSKIAKKQASEEKTEEKPAKKATKTSKDTSESKGPAAAPQAPAKEESAPRVRARSKSAFADGAIPETKSKIVEESTPVEELVSEEEPIFEEISKSKSSEELRRGIFAQEIEELSEKKQEKVSYTPEPIINPQPVPEKKEIPVIPELKQKPIETSPPVQTPVAYNRPAPLAQQHRPMAQLNRREDRFVNPPPRETYRQAPRDTHPARPQGEHVKLGPTGRHVKDLIPPPRKPSPRPPHTGAGGRPPHVPPSVPSDKEGAADKSKKFKSRETTDVVEEEKKGPFVKAKEFRDIKPARRDQTRQFDGRDRLGLRADDDQPHWKKKRKQVKHIQEDVTIRPTSLTIRTPISIKDLASEMKLKSSQLISKLFMQGLVVTLNDLLEDETTIQLLGHEFGCEIKIDTSEEKRIRITDKTVLEEIKDVSEDQLIMRAPVVAFMGHVDHGKTSLIDAIRSTNRAAGEAGAITQHIGAFKCTTAVGDICILDTPGHEAFSAMRARGADVTDIVVLVVAGDEGLRQQTIEAIKHARDAKVTIVVAINKSDKPNFNPENVYRQLAEQELLPEAWGGQTITVNCSAVTRAGIDTLLEMLALQAEVLELRADPSSRARGRVLESEMHKGMGAVATVLVQNGTLRIGDSLVFDQYWGKVKTMQDEFNKNIEEAGPSTPVAITGLSGLPEAGQEFIVVKNEKEAREIAEVRMVGMRQNTMMKKKLSVENLMLQASEPIKKVLNIILRADVQGSLEALKVGLLKIESKKAEVNIISAGVGEVSESDVQLASTSNAVIIGFHTQVESHAEALIRQLGIKIKMHDIIYHAIDDAKLLLIDLLDKIAIETDKGKFQVKALFKSSQHGTIAGGIVTDGTILRNNHVRIIRDGEVIAKSPISSLKRLKDDVREVSKGLECGIVLASFTDAKEGDIFESYEVTYMTQEL